MNNDLINTDWLKYENEAENDGFKIICGVDEAGRGPLAGRVYAAAVVLPRGMIIDGVNDSKKLSEKKREMLFDIIVSSAEDYCIAYAQQDEIDEMNILNATMLAMTRAVSGLKNSPDFVLIDGNKTPRGLSVPAKAVVKGDANSESIACASILAKVSRDRYMLEMSEKYPQYRFEKHKGYGTKLHYEMLDKYGPCEIHRKSFLKTWYERKK